MPKGKEQVRPVARDEGRYVYPARDGSRVWNLYGCARRGCEAINLDFESYGAYGKSWCLHHPPLRIRIQRWLGRDV